MRIVAISGSLQRASTNHALLERARELAPRGMELVLYEGVRALPHFDLDLAEAEPPESVRHHRATLAGADGLLIASPEYGHSLPGALKNAIDWVFPTGELYQKPVAITASVRDPNRGWRGLRALRQTLLALDARVLGGAPIVFHPGEEDADDALLGLLADLHRAAEGDEHAESASGGAATVPLPAFFRELIAMTSLEDCVRVPVADAGREGSLIDAAATTLGAEIARTLTTLPRGELDDILRRVESELSAAESDERSAVREFLLPTMLDRLDGTAHLESVLDRLGPRALAALGLDE